MARFDKLEFDDGEQHRKAVEPEIAARRDDIDWMQRADQHRRTGRMKMP